MVIISGKKATECFVKENIIKYFHPFIQNVIIPRSVSNNHQNYLTPQVCIDNKNVALI